MIGGSRAYRQVLVLVSHVMLSLRVSLVGGGASQAENKPPGRSTFGCAVQSGLMCRRYGSAFFSGQYLVMAPPDHGSFTVLKESLTISRAWEESWYSISLLINLMNGTLRKLLDTGVVLRLGFEWGQARPDLLI